jgi:glucose/arabinose dehydrogenase
MLKTSLFAVLVIATSSHAQVKLPAGMRPPGCTAGLQLPDGFCATLFAEGVAGARHIVVAPNGDVFVNTEGRRGRRTQGDTANGGILALRDTNRDGRADVQQRFGVSGPGGTGIALDGNTIFATVGNSIVRYRLAPDGLSPTGAPDTIVTDLPMTGSHKSHNFVVQGSSLFVNIGSASNACQQGDRQAGSLGQNPCTELETRAGIWRFDANRLRQRQTDGSRFATGLRNSVALTHNPIDGRLYATVHGRDQLHDNWPRLFTAEKSAENPGEALVRIDRNADYGWPYCYHAFDRPRARSGIRRGRTENRTMLDQGRGADGLPRTLGAERHAVLYGEAVSGRVSGWSIRRIPRILESRAPPAGGIPGGIRTVSLEASGWIVLNLC